MKAALLSIAVLAAPTHALVSSATEGRPPFAEVRLIRSESGTKGSQQGEQYIIEDPRNAFHYPEDQRIIVYFEWDGPAGLHHFEGRWKNPRGKGVVFSDFEYEARGTRFGAYWTLQLNETTEPGLWAIEAIVDSEPAGMHAFQILLEADPSLTAPRRRLLTASEIYEEAVSSTVFVENVDDAGQTRSVGSAFFVSAQMVLTAFQVIDGASSLRIIDPAGNRVEVEGVIDWDRGRNWAFLKTPSGNHSSSTLAGTDTWAVGDSCFSLDAPMIGSRVIASGTIIGRQESHETGQRLNLSMYLSPQAVGSPILNQYGEVIGIFARGDAFPGLASLEALEYRYPANLPQGFRQSVGAPVRITDVPDAARAPTSIAELARRGQFVPPLAPMEHLYRGTIARHYEWDKRKEPEIIGESFEFSRRDPHIVVILEWSPTDKYEGQALLRLYALDNRLLMESEQAKLKLKAGNRAVSHWNLNISRLAHAVYRVDIVVGQEPIWRSFFKVTE